MARRIHYMMSEAYNLGYDDGYKDGYEEGRMVGTLETKEKQCKMTKEEYKNRMSEIYNEISELATERDLLINDRIALITKDLKDIGLRFGMEVDIVDDIVERRVVFNGVRCNNQYHLYLEFTYHDYTTSKSSCYVHHPMVVDINHDIKVILPEATFDYHTFMSNYQ